MYITTIRFLPLLLDSFLSSEFIRSDGHALMRTHLELPIAHGNLRIEGIEEGDRLALVPAVEQVQRSSCEDRAHGVHHALQHDKEHSSGTGTVLAMEDLHLVAVILQTLGLVYTN